MLIASIVVLWLVMWVVMIVIREKNLTWSEYNQDFRFIGHVFQGLFWPFFLTGWGIFLLAKKIANTEFKMPKLPRRVKQNEIAEGIPCPIDVLAQMAKASLLKDFRREYDHFKNDRVDLYAHSYNSRISRAAVTLTVGKVTLTDVELPDYVRDDLVEFYKQLLVLSQEQLEAERLAEIRNRALTGVETLLTLDNT